MEEGLSSPVPDNSGMDDNNMMVDNNHENHLETDGLNNFSKRSLL